MKQIISFFVILTIGIFCFSSGIEYADKLIFTAGRLDKHDFNFLDEDCVQVVAWSGHREYNVLIDPDTITNHGETSWFADPIKYIAIDKIEWHDFHFLDVDNFVLVK